MKQFGAYYFPFHIGNIGFVVVVVVTLKENSKGFKKVIIRKIKKLVIMANK